MASQSSAHDAGATRLSGLTVGGFVGGIVAAHPGATAVISAHQGLRVTYQELWDASGEIARGLLAQGVARGDRLALWSPNRYEWVVVQLAAARAGAVLVCVNPAYTPAELRYVLEHAGVSTVVMARGFRRHDYVAALESVRGQCPELRRSFVIDDDWERLRDAARGVPPEALARREAEVGCDDPLSILYTSGTTGRPKGATLSHHNLVNNAHLTCAVLGFGVGERVCVPAPFYHVFGMATGVLGCLTHGAALVIPGEAFEPESVLRAVQDHRCTSLYGVPTMFVAEMAHEKFGTFDLSSLRTGLVGGAPCLVELIRRVRQSMGMEHLSIISGMTETSPTATQTLPADPEDRRDGTVGRPSEHVEVRIVDAATGRTAPAGTTGEMCVRGYNVMLGYWADPDATRAAVDEAGWMHTGDLATMDGDGYVSVVGRLKDVIIRGGENIYPREVEEVLNTHADVVDAQVIGVPDETYGERVMAWVRLRAGAACTAETLTAHCRGHLSTPKVPVSWRFVSEYPTTASGKVQKFRMREIATEQHLEGSAAR